MLIHRFIEIMYMSHRKILKSRIAEQGILTIARSDQWWYNVVHVIENGAVSRIELKHHLFLHFSEHFKRNREFDFTILVLISSRIR